jgi:hypothetical protein
MARRKTLRTLDRSLLIAAAASLVAVASMGVVVHGIMWSRVPGETASEKLSPAAPKTPVRISSKTLAA